MQLNDVVIAGFLGRDAEVFQTAKGTSIVTLNVAYSNKYTDRDGVTVESTTWCPVKVFNPWSLSAKDFKKGDNVVVKGSLSENKWTDKETGKERSKLEIKAFAIARISKKEASDNSYSESTARLKKEPKPAKTFSEFGEGDLPF